MTQGQQQMQQIVLHPLINSNKGALIILQTAAKRLSESTHDGTCCWTEEGESQLAAWQKSWACLVYQLGKLLCGVGHGNLKIYGQNSTTQKEQHSDHGSIICR